MLQAKNWKKNSFFFLSIFCLINLFTNKGHQKKKKKKVFFFFFSRIPFLTKKEIQRTEAFFCYIFSLFFFVVIFVYLFQKKKKFDEGLYFFLWRDLSLLFLKRKDKKKVYSLVFWKEKIRRRPSFLSFEKTKGLSSLLLIFSKNKRVCNLFFNESLYSLVVFRGPFLLSLKRVCIPPSYFFLFWKDTRVCIPLSYLLRGFVSLSRIF